MKIKTSELTAKLNAHIRFYLNFTVAQKEYARVCAARHKHPTDSWEDSKRMVATVGRLANCTETCDSHVVWAEFEPKAKTWRGLQAEVAQTRAKVERIIARYVGRPVPLDH